MTTPTIDSLTNVVSGLGTAQDKRYANRIAAPTVDWTVYSDSYEGSWIARKVIDAPADDATREWREWGEEYSDRVEDEEKRLDVKNVARSALIQSRIFGGAVVYMQFAEQDPASELVASDSAAIEKLSVFGSNRVSGGANEGDDVVMLGGVPVHTSRLLVFSPLESVRNTGLAKALTFGPSVLAGMLDAIRDLEMISASAAALVSEAKTDVVSIPELFVNMGDPVYEARLRERFAVASQAKSTINTLLLDSDEQWQRIATNVSGIEGLWRQAMLTVSGASDIPLTRFMGQTPSGLASTGEADLRNYYDAVRSVQQERVLRQSLSHLDELMAGGEPDYEWRPLWQPTLPEKLAAEKTKAEIVLADLSAGLIDEEVLRRARIAQLSQSDLYPGFAQIVKDVEEEFGSELEQEEEEDRAPPIPPDPEDDIDEEEGEDGD